MNSSLTVDNTTSSTVSQSDSAPTYTTKFNFDFDTQEGINELETLLKKSPYVNDEILSVDDVLVFENLRQSKALIVQKKHPYIFSWCRQLEQLRRNWRLSTKKEKGSTFAQSIKNAEEKLRKAKNEQSENDLITGLTIENKKDSNVNLKNDYNVKYKKLNEYHMEIGITFKTDSSKNWTEIASNLSIICQAFFPRDTEIKPINDSKTGEIFAVISTRIHKDKYDLSYIEQDIKRNIECVDNIHIIEIKEIKPNKPIDLFKNGINL